MKQGLNYLIKIFLIFLIKIYQVTLSPLLVFLFGRACKYELTCSRFAEAAIKENGAVKGSFLAIRRLLTCHSFSF